MAAKKKKPVARKAAGRKAKKAPGMPGRPTLQTPELLARICAGLSRGTPLTILCEAPGMPCDDTVRNWMEADEGVFRDIGRARARGHDRLAWEALQIADRQCEGVRVEIVHDGEVETRKEVREDMLGHRKLQIETRLKLLAKWDPARYGATVRTELSTAAGKPLQIAAAAELSEDQERRIVEAAAVAAALVPPACMAGGAVEAAAEPPDGE